MSPDALLIAGAIALHALATLIAGARIARATDRVRTVAFLIEARLKALRPDLGPLAASLHALRKELRQSRRSAPAAAPEAGADA